MPWLYLVRFFRFWTISNILKHSGLYSLGARRYAGMIQTSAMVRT